MKLFSRASIGLAGALATAAFAFAGQTTIDFTPLGQPPYSLADYNAIPSNYDSLAPNTPDVEVSYSSNNPLDISQVLEPDMSYWGTGYGSLSAVAYPTENGQYGVISLTPEAGYSVTLDSFEIAGYGGDQHNQSLGIDNGSFQILDPSFNYAADLTFPGSGYTLLSPEITSTGTINIVFGTSWNSGIEDITFTQQAVGVPDGASSVGLLCLGLVAIAVYSRRQRPVTTC
jgi:hypothetical protein